MIVVTPPPPDPMFIPNLRDEVIAVCATHNFRVIAITPWTAAHFRKMGRDSYDTCQDAALLGTGVLGKLIPSGPVIVQIPKGDDRFEGDIAIFGANKIVGPYQRVELECLKDRKAWMTTHAAHFPRP